MDAVAFKEYLDKRYYDQLSYYEKTSGKNQRKYKFFQWSLIILSTLTTILAAVPRSEKFDLQYVVVISAAIVTILTSALKTFQYQELWVSYRTTIEQLKPEIYYYHFSVGDYGQAGVDKESLFVTRVEGILSKEHDAWPVFKQLIGAAGEQEKQNAELQRKLDVLAREKFNETRPVVEKEEPGEKPVETDPVQQDQTKPVTVTPSESVTPPDDNGEVKPENE